MKKWTLLVVFGLALFLIFPIATASAEEPISVAANSYQNEFPSQIKFKLEASSDQEITRVSLYYRMRGSAVLTYAYPKFDKGNSVSVEYVWNTQRKYIPPGVELRYYWQIENAAGTKIRTAPVSFVIEDTRFKWQNITEDNISLFWYGGDQAFGRRLVGIAQQALDKLGQDIGITVQEPVKLFIYATQRDFLGALEPKAQEWTGGRSFSSQAIIALMVEPTGEGIPWAARAIPHELSHVVTYQAIKNPYGDIPHWLDEGLAMHAEGEAELGYTRVLDRAIRQNRLISLKSLASNFPADPEQATLSYAQSQSVVEYILDQYGRDKMSELLAVFREGSTYDDALLAVFGIDVAGLDAEWRASVGAAPPPQSKTGPAPAQTRSQPAQSPQLCTGVGIGLGLGATLAAAAKVLPLVLG
ncbi:MAG: peptidase MA domain-containing protein [Chloroflexi bacterium]|nr:peptidase MA domain-containing protein [Chloroflexota bacterium]